VNTMTVTILLLIAMVVGVPAEAGATGAKTAVNNGGDTPQGQPQQTATARDNVPRDPRLAYSDPRLQYSDPRLQYSDPRLQYVDPRLQSLDPGKDPRAIHRQPAPTVIVVTQPVYVAAPPACVVPGYWAYAWVPQSYASSMWVPGYYNSDALWVEGHYESRTYTWGYYQPYWVPERGC
jgi:hypothetical protein